MECFSCILLTFYYVFYFGMKLSLDNIFIHYVCFAVCFIGNRSYMHTGRIPQIKKIQAPYVHWYGNLLFLPGFTMRHAGR